MRLKSSGDQTLFERRLIQGLLGCLLLQFETEVSRIYLQNILMRQRVQPH